MIQTRMLEGADHSYAIQRTQDVEPIVNYTREMQAVGAGNAADLKHAAEIPMIFVEQYLSRTGISFADFCAAPDHIRSVVNDPALAAFRVWKGRV